MFPNCTFCGGEGTEKLNFEVAKVIKSHGTARTTSYGYALHIVMVTLNVTCTVRAYPYFFRVAYDDGAQYEATDFNCPPRYSGEP